MLVLIVDNVTCKGIKPFTDNFDKVFVSVSDDFECEMEFKLKPSTLPRLIGCLDYSWDGEIYYFNNSVRNKVLSALEEWFNKETSHTQVDDMSISNCFLIKNTSDGFILIDTQLDMSSNIVDFLSTLKSLYPDLDYDCYSDCHLINNMYLGRNSVDNEFEYFYSLFKDGVIDSSFFFRSLDRIGEDEDLEDIIPNDRPIVITGTFPLDRECMLAELNDTGFKTSDKVSANTWLWMGERVGSKKIAAAKAKGAMCSTIEQIIDIAYNNYLKKKQAST